MVFKLKNAQEKAMFYIYKKKAITKPNFLFLIYLILHLLIYQPNFLFLQLNVVIGIKINKIKISRPFITDSGQSTNDQSGQPSAFAIAWYM